MKKNFILFIATALLLAVSCIKEEANVAGEKELITVKLNPLTKTQLDPDGTNTFWSEGDVVSVSVGGNKIGDLTLVEDDVFSGEIESGYDNNDEVVLNYPSGVTDVPSVQEAVENSFANGSALLEGTTTIGDLRKGKGASLQNKTALLQFSVAYDGDVTFSVGSKKYTVTGCIADALYYACIEPVVDASLSFTLSEVGGLKSKPTVTFEANKLYKLGELDIIKTDRGLAFPGSNYTETYGNDFAEPELSGVVDGVTYSSNNTAVAVVDPKTGAITLKGGGTAVITAQVPDNRTYYGGSVSYTLTVNKADRNLKFSNTEVVGYTSGWVEIPTLSGKTDGVTYTSSDPAVASVNSNNGKLTITEKKGETVITASAPETDQYLSGSVTYTLTVNQSNIRIYIRLWPKINGWDKWKNDPYIYYWGTYASANFPGNKLSYEKHYDQYDYYYEFEFSKTKKISFVVTCNQGEQSYDVANISLDKNYYYSVYTEWHDGGKLTINQDSTSNP